MADWLRRAGWYVHFLASTLTARFIRSRLPNAVTELNGDLAANQAVWHRTVAELSPDAVVFADYPLLCFSSGKTPLRDEGWEADLVESRTPMFTLDHLGYAQRARLVFFGPSHRTIGVERVPARPPRMQVLLPCPLHDPLHTTLDGQPFRYWDAQPPDETADIRRRFARSAEELLILHCTSGWICRAAELVGCPYFSFLPRLLAFYLADLERPVTVISMNDRSLIPEVTAGSLRTLNIRPVDPPEFEALLNSCDLVMMENRISVSLAKAIHLRKPCVVLRNSFSIGDILESAPLELCRIAQDMERQCLGSVFPFDVFPIWAREDLEELGIFRQCGAAGAFGAVEIFGGESTAARLRNLLIDASARDQMRADQSAYLARVRSLPTPPDVLDPSATWDPSHSARVQS